MPRINHQYSAAQAKTYYQHGYYEAHENVLGRWFSRGAELLGLHGEVEQTAFERLIDNMHPFLNTQLTPRMRLDRRVGTDITFSASKSVSILWAITQDKAILDAVLESAQETLRDMERDAQTRVNTARNCMHLKKTGVMVGATWLHTLSRPVDGVSDPQLHVHAWIANATHDGDRWTALDMSAMVKDSKYYDGLFHSRLASKLQALGYPIVRSKHNFEIEGIDRSTIEEFSRRTAQIEQKAAELGITNRDAKDKLGATTREKKSSEIPYDQLPSLWNQRLSDEERASFANLKRSIAISPPSVASKAVDFAEKHHFERQSVVRERDLLTTALFQGMGEATVDEILREAARRPWIREGVGDKADVTTREILQEEQRILSFARKGRGAVAPIAEKPKLSRDRLNPSQIQVVKGLLTSTNRLNIFRGVAGSGKSKAAVDLLEFVEAAGTPVVVLAPTAGAVEVLKSDGIDARTLASFLTDKQLHSELHQPLIYVDEAGLVGTKDLSTLVAIAERTDARVILSGDSMQHQPIARGHAMRLLEEHAGIRPFALTRIRRQEEAKHRSAVEAFSRGEVLNGFDQLNGSGAIHELNDTERYKTLAKDYADTVQQGQTALVIAPTHAERDLVTLSIREELRSRGMLRGSDRQLSVLRSKNLTVAERGDPLLYAPGDVIDFMARGKGGFLPGDRLVVQSIERDGVIAESTHGRVYVPLSSAGAFDVFRQETAPFAIGDKVRITRNRRAQQKNPRLTNGHIHTLTGFTPTGDMKLDDNIVLNHNWGHIDHGTMTSYASQGKTVARAFVAQSSISFPASSPEQMYVSSSRSVKRVDIYTDSISDLRNAIQQSRTKRHASELGFKPQLALNDQTLTRSKLRRLISFGRELATRQLERLQYAREQLVHNPSRISVQR